MHENIDEVLAELDKILEYLEEANYDDRFHVALEVGHQFRDELASSMED